MVALASIFIGRFASQNVLIAISIPTFQNPLTKKHGRRPIALRLIGWARKLANVPCGRFSLAAAPPA